MPNPPTSVSPRSRRNTNFAHAHGVNRRAGPLGTRFRRSSRLGLFRMGILLCFLAGIADVVFETGRAEVLPAFGARQRAAATDGLAAVRAGCSTLATARA